MVAHAFNPSTWEAEAGVFQSLRPAWSTEWVPGQPGLHRETLSRKTKQNKTKNKNKQKKKKMKKTPHMKWVYLFIYFTQRIEYWVNTWYWSIFEIFKVDQYFGFMIIMINAKKAALKKLHNIEEQKHIRDFL